MSPKIIICHINYSNCIETDDKSSLRKLQGINIVSCLRIDNKIVKTVKSATFYLLEYISRKWYFLLFIHLTLQKSNRRENNDNFKKKLS